MATLATGVTDASHDALARLVGFGLSADAANDVLADPLV
jgi:hypothetical protein